VAENIEKRNLEDTLDIGRRQRAGKGFPMIVQIDIQPEIAAPRRDVDQ
jgi:hypothetical protein